MGEVELPLVDASIVIENALEIMQAERCSGLVTLRDDRLVVFELEELVDELRERGNKKLMELTPLMRTEVISPAATGMPAAPRSTEVPRRHALGTEMFDAFQSSDNDYFVHTGQGGTLIRIVTRHEGLQARVSASPVLCACEDGHRYSQRQSQTRNFKCTMLPATKTIVCGGDN